MSEQFILSLGPAGILFRCF